MEDKVRSEVMNLCVLMHQTVRETSAAYLAQARRPGRVERLLDPSVARWFRGRVDASKPGGGWFDFANAAQTERLICDAFPTPQRTNSANGRSSFVCFVVKNAQFYRLPSVLQLTSQLQ